jgi:hypothetical protein
MISDTATITDTDYPLRTSHKESELSLCAYTDYEGVWGV